MLRKFIIFAVVLSICFPLVAQDKGKSSNPNPVFGGIAVEYGIGKLSIRDEYISKEKYSGNIPYFQSTWSKYDQDSGYAIGLQQRYSTEIMNYNMRTHITQFSLFYDKQHRNTKLFKASPDIVLMLGPSINFHTTFFDQKVAGNGLNASFSFFSLFSLGLNSQLYYPINNKIWAIGTIKTNLISVGLRMVDFAGDDEEPLRFLTPLSASNTMISAGIQYSVSEKIPIRLSYKFQLLRLTEWDPILSASDNFTVELKYKF